VRQYVWVWLIVALVLTTPLAVDLLLRGGPGPYGVGLGFVMGTMIWTLRRELKLRRAGRR
jgi:hypothetical protein